MKNRLRSARPQGSATASRRAVRVLDGVFASAPVSVIKGADAPFFLQKGVTHVREHLLPMSEVHRESGGQRPGRVVEIAREGVPKQHACVFAFGTSPRAIFDGAALLAQEGVAMARDFKRLH